MDDQIREILAFLKREDDYLLTTHMNADGDAYASVLAMACYLERTGKKYEIIIHDDKISEKYDFLWGFENIRSFSEVSNRKFRAALSLDVPSLGRIGNPAELLPERELCVKIDHHPFEEDFAALQLVDVKASSTSQLVYEILSRSDIQLDDQLATLMFTGILYDTGRFSFSNTSRRDFEIAAELLQYNVAPSMIANRVFFNNSFQSMKTIGYGLENMTSYLDGRVAVIHLPLEIMEQNNHAEIEELSNYSVAIHNVEVGLFVREVKPQYYKISFRSKGRVDVNATARVFGGGGHKHAAGCRISGEFSRIIDDIVREIDSRL